jgi:hypothetical protein
VYSIRTRFLIAQLYEENALVVYDAENEIERLGTIAIPDLIDCVCSCASRGDAADVVKGRCDHLLFRVTKFDVPFEESEQYPTSSCDTWSKWWDNVGVRRAKAARAKLINRPAEPRRMDLLVRLCVLSRRSAWEYAVGELYRYERKALVPFLIDQLKDSALGICGDDFNEFLRSEWREGPSIGGGLPRRKMIGAWKHWWETKGRRKRLSESEAAELEFVKGLWGEDQFSCGEAEQGTVPPDDGSSDGTSGTQSPTATPAATPRAYE